MQPDDTVPADLAALCTMAVDLARGAGQLVRAGRAESGGQLGVKSSPTDAVTAMDLASEAYLADTIARYRPDDGLLGEEGVGRRGSTGIRWIVDPIDGTVNYLYGIAAYSVSVAVEVDGVVAVGVIHAPESGELFRATLGGGAWSGHRRLRCGNESDLGQALVSTGFGYDSERRRGQGAVLAALLPRIRDVRRMGSAALDLCHVAAGRLDAHYEQGLALWDHAAGGLIAAESGAVVAGLHGAPAGGECLVAAGPGLIHQLVAALEDLIPPAAD